MATPIIAGGNTNSVSQHPSTPSVETVREEIDIGDFVVGPDLDPPYKLFFLPYKIEDTNLTGEED